MKNKTSIYQSKAKPEAIYKSIREEIHSNFLKKSKNLTGEMSQEGGYNLHSKISFGAFRPSFGPLVQLNVMVNEKANGLTEVQFKRINGLTYKVHIVFPIILSCIGALISFYIMYSKDVNEAVDFLFLPLFGLLYALFIELIAITAISSLKSRTKALLSNNDISLKP